MSGNSGRRASRSAGLTRPRRQPRDLGIAEPSALEPQSTSVRGNSDIRDWLLASLAVVTVISGSISVYIAKTSNDTAALTQAADRFSQSIAQLADDNEAVRLGGIYAIDRISRENSDYTGQVVDILGAYVQSRSQSLTAESLPTPKALHRPGADLLTAIQMLNVGDSTAKSHLAGIDLHETDLQRVSLPGADLVGAELSGSLLNGADLTGANLQYAVLRGTGLTSILQQNTPYQRVSGGPAADLTGADLGSADLTSASMAFVSLDEANLRYALLADAMLQGAFISDADLTSAKLSGADLNHSTLTRSNLSNADLSGADLSGAHLGNANLSSADLTSANLMETDLSGIVCTAATLWPGSATPAGVQCSS